MAKGGPDQIVARKGAPRESGAASKGAAPISIEFKSALKPKKGLFVGLLVAFTLWVLFLVILYLKTASPPHRL